MPSMTEKKCKCCGATFMARTADVKRGWGKFCSKSCKAIKQEQKTKQHSNYLARKQAMLDALIIDHEYCDSLDELSQYGDKD